jgi:hypothetical protein
VKTASCILFVSARHQLAWENSTHPVQCSPSRPGRNPSPARGTWHPPSTLRREMPGCFAAPPPPLALRSIRCELSHASPGEKYARLLHRRNTPLSQLFL